MILNYIYNTNIHSIATQLRKFFLYIAYYLNFEK